MPDGSLDSGSTVKIIGIHKGQIYHRSYHAQYCHSKNRCPLAYQQNHCQNTSGPKEQQHSKPFPTHSIPCRCHHARHAAADNRSRNFPYTPRSHSEEQHPDQHGFGDQGMCPQHQHIGKDKTAVVKRKHIHSLHSVHVPPPGKHLPHDTSRKKGRRQVEDEGRNQNPKFSRIDSDKQDNRSQQAFSGALILGPQKLFGECFNGVLHRSASPGYFRQQSPRQ